MDIPMNLYHDRQWGACKTTLVCRKGFFRHANIQVETLELVIARDRVIHAS